MPAYPSQSARSRDWRAANPDKVRSQNERRIFEPERHARRMRAWRAANPDKVAAQRARRTARNALPAGATCQVCGTAKHVVRDWKRNGRACRRCITAANMMHDSARAAALACYLALA